MSTAGDFSGKLPCLSAPHSSARADLGQKEETNNPSLHFFSNLVQYGFNEHIGEQEISLFSHGEVFVVIYGAEIIRCYLLFFLYLESA